MKSITRSHVNRFLAGSLLPAFLLLPRETPAQIDLLTQHNDNARTGANLEETTLTPMNVTEKLFGMLFKRVVDDQLYTQPLLAAHINIGGGTHDVVYVTTVNNSVYAFDANDASATAPLWHVNFGTPANLHDWRRITLPSFAKTTAFTGQLLLDVGYD